MTTPEPTLEFAIQQHQAGKLGEAETIYRQILFREPKHSEIMRLLGVLACQTNRPAMGHDLLRDALKIQPDNANYLCDFATALTLLGRIDQALATYRQVLSLHPDSVGAFLGMGKILRSQGCLDESADLYRRAISIKPDVFELHNALGGVLLAKGDPNGAVAALQRGVELPPQSGYAFHNLAFALDQAGRFEEAETNYLKSLELQPLVIVPRLNYATLLVTLGKPNQAWEQFMKAAEVQDPLQEKYAGRKWDGSDPRGKTILVYFERTFGDTLWQARCIPMLQEKGANIILQCQPPLIPLFESLNLQQIVPLGKPVPHFDFYAYGGWLPKQLGMRFDNIQNLIPYLSVPVDRIQRWSSRISDHTKLNVGLIWAGSDTNLRSDALHIFSPLANVPGVRFFSLQKGPASSQKPPPGLELIDYTSQINDFADTAALLHHLDLLISVDTSTPHLAGAMGKPVWVLLPTRSNLLWLTDRSDTPWYPTMRLFRQTRMGDWETPVREIVNALQSMKPIR